MSGNERKITIAILDKDKDRSNAAKITVKIV